MSFVPNDGKANKCSKCAKTVYPNESIRAANGVYHKGCLKCTQCNITLNLKTCMSHQSKPYCKTHVPKVGHTQVASVEMSSALSAPKAANKVQGVAKNERMSFAPGRGRGAARGAARGGAPRGGAAAPRAAPAGGGYRGPNTMKVGGGGNKCPGCGKTVYTNEEIVACGGRWHKGCLKCEVCKLTLNLKNIQTHQNKPYCKTHVPKVSHTQVASVEMQNAMKAPKAARAVKGVNRAARGTFAPGALNAVAGADVVNKGGVAGSDVQSAHAPKQTFVAPEPAASITYDTPDDQFSSMSVSDQGGYDDGGYDAGGYDAGGYDEGGYDAGGYEEPAAGGYDEGGYDAGGYDEGGYEEPAAGGYDEGGYDEGGYDEGGYDEGYAEEGYAEEGYDEGYGGYDEGGYDEGGYDEGYYEEGGYDEGYDEGYYDEGYDEGY